MGPALRTEQCTGQPRRTAHFQEGRDTITRVQQVNRALDCSLETATEQLINDLLSGTVREE